MNSFLKVLCIGDNSSTDAWAHKLTEKFAEENNLLFRGELQKNVSIQHGCYHIGPVVHQQKDIIEMSKQFDQVVLLDQKQDQFSHSRIFLATWKLVKDLKDKDIQVKVLNRENMAYLDDWEKIFAENKSICMNPWILLHDGQNSYTNLCGRNWDRIKKREDITEWQDDKEYNEIRNKMIDGEKISGCYGCYNLEEQGIRDMRWTDSFDWITRLRIKTPEDLKKIKNPCYVEIRPSNKCNLKCRMCKPQWSHLIHQETKSIQDQKFKDIANTIQHAHMNKFDTASFDLVDLDSIVRLYIAGGEPTVMPEVYEFLRKCVKNKKTDFEFGINTNAVKISEKLFDLFKNFSKLWFTVSIDGVGKINEYQRWGTDSAKQIENIHRLRLHAGIHIISVVSIYNVHDIGKTMQFFDNEFPYAKVQLNWAGYHKDILSPKNHPKHELVLNSLELAKKTKCYYHQERGSKPIIDGLHAWYSTNPKVDRQKLSDFFYYNDTLDKHRGCKLSDYIPELEECRKYIKQH